MQERAHKPKPKPKVKSLKQPKLIAGFASRSVALDALLAVERESVFANVALATAFKNQGLSERDRAFVTALVQGVTRHRLELDEAIDAASQRPGGKIDLVARNILRIGAFQLTYMPNIPQQAILNTATELAKVRGHVGLGKFTNGLLRHIAHQASAAVAPATSYGTQVPSVGQSGGQSGERSGEQSGGHSAEHPGEQSDKLSNNRSAIQIGNENGITKDNRFRGNKANKHNKPGKVENSGKHLREVSDEKNSQTKAERTLAERYSMPDWLVDRWIRNYGEEETIKLLQFAQTPPALSIRTCELSITPEGLQEILERQGLSVKRSALVNSCLIIERGRISESTDKGGLSAPGKTDASTNAQIKSRKSASSFRGSPEKLTGYSEGLFSIQDESAAFVSLIVEPKSTDFIIDLCAAPGGKTLHIAELMENKGRVVAVDQSASRLTPLKESRTRLGLKNLEIVAHDGRTFKSPMLADKILVDAPCTGTGVINRRADLRFKRKPEDLASLIELQRELLQNASRCIKPGGSLIYSTCSVEPEENFANAQWFLDNFEEFEPEDISRHLPPAILAECAPRWEGPACKSKMEEALVYSVQLLPSRHHVSGFFVAKFRKKFQTQVN
jgi:16S rRNA (cytosine967-C5)-methyltransferase